jgi:DNA mismatch repair protein MutL
MTAGTIRLLSSQTVNRIAAGEVIERPAAAVKELVENAIDAGATRIEVILAGGGIDRIEVIDDGGGIAAADLALAIERHATSKLADRIAVAGGVVAAVSPCAGVPGTRAIVEDLFYATPARKKFLRSPRAEGEAAEQAVWRLAMAAPGIAFRLVADERVVFDLPSQSEAARVAALFGRDTASGMLSLEAERDGVILSGLAGPASVSRATNRLQSFVVNGRPVVDPLLRMALRLAYRDVIVSGRHPVAALRLRLPPEALDVNVHPAKTELRFADANGVRSLVIGAIGRLLERPVSLAGAPPARPALSLRPLATPAARGFAEAELALLSAPAARGFMSAEPAEERFPLGAPVAQILDTYVLAVAADGALVIIDQHAAHERLTEERLRAEFLAGRVVAQPLLIPVVVDLGAGDAMRLLGQSGPLARLGLEVEAFGPGAVLVRAVPAALRDADAAGLVRDLAEEFAECDTPVALEARLDSALARLACHRSIRAGRRLAPAEMSALLREMEATPRAATCSHGRPTFLKLTKADLERLFGRTG